MEFQRIVSWMSGKHYQVLVNTFCPILCHKNKILKCNVFTFAQYILKLTFSKTSFRNTIRVSKVLDQDKDRHSVGPDLDPNCLKRLSADDKSRH